MVIPVTVTIPVPSVDSGIDTPFGRKFINQPDKVVGTYNISIDQENLTLIINKLIDIVREKIDLN